MPINIQIGGSNNQQVIQQNATSLGKLLNAAEARLQERMFKSDVVKQKYLALLSELSTWIFSNKQHAFDATTFILYPFKTLPEEETFQDKYFLEAFLDTLTIMAFLELECRVEHHYLNIRIDGKQVYGIYYRPGLDDVVNHFQRLIKSLKLKDVILPVGFIFVILNCMAEPLDSRKILNIVTDILGDDPYIKPLKTGSPKCLTLTSHVIQECLTVNEARDYLRGVLSIA